MRIIKTILLFLFIAAIVLFTVQNMEIVKLSFLNWHLKIPLSIASVLIYVLGAISGGLVFSMIKKITVKNDIDESKKEN